MIISFIYEIKNNKEIQKLFVKINLCDWNEKQKLSSEELLICIKKEN